MKRETLGVCMIVKNEESCLGKCLESIKGIDEIVILDTGSTDKTGDIARQHGARFIENVYKWEDDFSKARNKALEFATADWILVIDADETLSRGGLKKIREAIKKADERTLGLKLDMVSACKTVRHEIARIHRRRPDIFWKGAAHNYLTVQDGPKVDVEITYGWSKAHNLDPTRTFRILKKFVRKNPTKPRELYYLAREYFARGEYGMAKKYYERYLRVATWGPEIADAHLMIAKCAVGIGNYDRAWLAAFKALQINADLSEGLQTLAALSGPNNRRKWLEYARQAKNKKALFIREVQGLEEVTEKNADYYREMFAKYPDMGRYENIYKMAGSMCKGKVLDMGCGTGEFRKHVPSDCEYLGFDFSGVAKGKCFKKGDIYKYPLKGYDTYICLEVLEHVDDIKVLERIPSGSTFIYSVPSFPDPAHIRTYTIDMMIDRYRDYFSDMQIRRYNFHDGKWIDGDPETENHILLVKAVRR
jgi:glycosyltransferase involved in cell wall biosynthesis